MEFSTATTERGPVFSVGRVAVHVPSDTPRLAPLVPALTGFIAAANETASVVRPEILTAQLARPIAPLLSTTRKVMDAAIENAKEVASDTAKALMPPPAVADAAARFGAEIRATVRNARQGEQVAAVNRASAVELAALLEADGSLSGLSSQALDMARDRALKLFHIARTGLNGRNPAMPSIERIVAIGTDDDATNAQADAALARYKQRVQSVEADEAVMQRLVTFIAAALDITPAQALDKIMAAG